MKKKNQKKKDSLKKILKVKCKQCGTVLEGGTYHNMEWCECKSVAFDWHDVWPRIAFKDKKLVQVSYDGKNWQNMEVD
jgi:hypothetical protein